MDLSITTPALLFPAISLLLLAYTNRFLTIANLIRQLHTSYKAQPLPETLGQIQNLRQRVILINKMQLYGITSLLLSVISMFLVFAKLQIAAYLVLGFSLVLLIISLTYTVREIQISVTSLNILLSDMEGELKK
jgi:hypothetical protein